MTVFHVVSTSGGKDSTATLALALERFPRDRVLPIFCDTGNEHEATYAYLDYLEERLGVRITRLKADFSEQIAAKRSFVARDQRTARQYERVPRTDKSGNVIYRRDNHGNPELRMVWRKGVMDLEGVPKLRKAHGKKVRWSNKAKRSAMLHMHPTGNPFLDLCIWKGRFPSRKAQFCTEELKRNMAVEFQQNLVDAGHRVVSWQGVRADESLNRRDAKFFERLNPRMYAHRPIVTWSAAQVFAYCASRDIEHNPLYRQGMSRVGCMPCINVNKSELRAISQRFPEHPERISQWEIIVGQCSKRMFSTMLADSHPAADRRQVFADLNIWARIEWSKTTRGGQQIDLFADEAPLACASAYGLCE